MTIQKIKSIAYYAVIALALTAAGLKQAHASGVANIVNISVYG